MTWQDVIQQFLRESERAHALLVLNDLRSWLEEVAAAERAPSLPMHAEWVRSIADYLSHEMAT